MKLEMTEGCTCFSYTVDGTEWVDLPVEKQRELAKYFVDNLDDASYLQELFIAFLREKGKYKDLGYCDCCGDHIENYKLTINGK